MEDIKCLLVSMGIGFCVGAMVTASNKKVQDIAKQAKQMAEEKYEMIKDGVNTAKEKIEDKIKENSENDQESEQEESVNKNKKTKRA